MPVINETTDAAGNTSTVYAMDSGDYFFGSLSTASESDWIEVYLEAGQTYTFGLTNVGALDDGLDDPFLRLRNSGGVQIAEDDDSGPGQNSAITFTATTSGTYYLDVRSWNNVTAGDYGLSMVTGTRPSYDVKMGAGALLREDASWAATSETGVTVTWGIRSSGMALDAAGVPTAFIGLSAAQIAAAQDTMALYDGISGLNLVQINPGGTTNDATMLFGAYSSTTDGAGAYAFFPGSTASSSDAGDLWLNNNSVSTTSLDVGSYSYFVMLHEIGHAVGLAHPGDYNAAPDVSITYQTHAQFTEDSHQYTVMSYFDESETTTNLFSYPDTLLLYDIYALHELYGADFSFHSGDTTYGFNATVGGAYDFSTNTDPLLSIWDGNGTDTLDVSGFAMNQVINLGDGQFSDIGGYQGNVSIAVGAIIENATAGTGNDVVMGNDVANTLTGNAGTDLIFGWAGDDTLIGGDQADILKGGDDRDMLLGGDGNDSIYGQNGDDTLHGDDGDDTLEGGFGSDLLYGGLNEDLLIGGSQADQLFGGAQQDTLLGEGGADQIYGEGGDDSAEGGVGSDTLYGDNGNDTLRGDDGYDVIDGGAGFDRLFGGDNDDTLFGGTQADVIKGGEGDDAMFGGGGNDRIFGQAGDDSAEGGNGTDLISGSWGNDTLRGDGGDDTLEGDAGEDVLFGGTNNDLLDGGSQADVLRGGDQQDTLLGGNGQDALFGNADSDTLNGGAGSDTLTGGLQGDTFVFVTGDGMDVITDFTLGLDSLSVNGLAENDFWAGSDWASYDDVAAGVRITMVSGDTILLEGVSEADLQAYYAAI